MYSYSFTGFPPTTDESVCLSLSLTLPLSLALSLSLSQLLRDLLLVAATQQTVYFVKACHHDKIFYSFQTVNYFTTKCGEEMHVKSLSQGLNVDLVKTRTRTRGFPTPKLSVYHLTTMSRKTKMRNIFRYETVAPFSK